MNLFYTTQIEGNLAILPMEEARHCVQVLRKKPGDRIHFIDGKGHLYIGNILEVSKKRCSVRIVDTEQLPTTPSVRIHIAIAPTKNISRMEWFLEKVTEIGISEITPIFCEHSERSRLRLDRLEKIILSATKQSLKAWLPKLNEPLKFKDFLEKLSDEEGVQRCIAYCHDDERVALNKYCEEGKDVVIMIGPEGDFSPQEVLLAFENGFTGVSLGKSRLRTETAGIVACHTLNLLNN